MPSSVEILEQMRAAATGLPWLAIAWHLIIVVAAAVLLRTRRLSSHVAVLLMVGPAVSVAVVAAIHGNPFNAVSFGLLSLLLARSASELGGPWSRGPRWMLILGTALVAFGFVYPHFNTGAWYRSLYAAPIGLVPCPTLAVLAGFTLLVGGYRSIAVSAVLAVWTAFYGVVGVVKLGVVIDVGLVAGMAGLLFGLTRALHARAARMTQ